MRNKKLVTIVALVLTYAICGCGSASESAGTYSTYDSEAAYDSYDYDDYDEDVSEAKANATSEPESTMIRRTADVQLSTRDFDAAAKALDELLDRYATVVLEQNEHNDSYQYSRRSLVARFRVDAGKFDELFAAIDEVDAWSVTSSQKYADDVTKQYRDTEQRIDALQVRYEWYKEQVQTTTDPDLARTYSDAMFDTLDEITRLENQNAELDTDVKYSVVSISLYEDTTVSDIDESIGLWDEIVNEAMVLPRNIAAAFGHLLLFLIAALPSVLVIACVVAVAVLIHKAWRRRHPAGTRTDRPRRRLFSRKRKAAPEAPAAIPPQPEVGNPEGKDSL